jgi:hypothetical protein
VATARHESRKWPDIREEGRENFSHLMGEGISGGGHIHIITYRGRVLLSQYQGIKVLVMYSTMGG